MVEGAGSPLAPRPGWAARPADPLSAQGMILATGPARVGLTQFASRFAARHECIGAVAGSRLGDLVDALAASLRASQRLRPRQRGRVYRIASARFGLLADELEVIARPRLACVDERPAVTPGKSCSDRRRCVRECRLRFDRVCRSGPRASLAIDPAPGVASSRACDGCLQQEGELRHGHTTLGTSTTDCRRSPPSTVDTPARAAIPRSSPHAYGPSHAATRQAAAVLRSAKSTGRSRA
jgi:hypothetical protein